MREQSSSYNPFPAVRDVDLTVRFALIDVDATDNATVTASGSEPFAQPEAVIDGIGGSDGDLATLELNSWTLDGTKETLGGRELHGWWSDSFSGDDSTFAADDPAYINFSFSAPVSTIGLTLYFDETSGQWPTKMRLSARNSSVLVGIETVELSGYIQTIELPLQNYTSLKIEILETFLPGVRAKMQEIVFGIVRTFGKNSLAGATMKYGADIASESFPSRELKFTFDNSDKKYNILNPEGIYAYLQDGQEITATVSIGGEPVEMGKFFFSAVEAKDSAVTAQITANDDAIALDGETFDGGSNTQTTLRSAAMTVLGPGATIQCIGSVGENIVRMAVPKGTTKRETLRLLAQAATCSVWIDRDGIVTFARLIVAEAPQSEITADELYSYDGVSVSEKVDAVALKVKNEFSGAETTYTAGAGKTVKTINNPCVAESEGQTVAEWLLSCYGRRKRYAVKNRCDPAVEVADTVRIADAFARRGNAVVTGIEITYDGGISAKTSGVGA